VVEKHPELRIMLGHFGRFRAVSQGYGQPGKACPSAPALMESWEGVIARYLRAKPEANLFADISYFSEVFDQRDGEHSRRRLKEYLAFDPGGRHLIFGSDWVMLGIEKAYDHKPTYAEKVVAFLASCGLRGEEIEGVMEKNALRFLGMAPGGRAHQRLLSFYSANSLPAKELPLAG
jgi:predicted TIM-barrel fold metal-dependent hydrolase